MKKTYKIEVDCAACALKMEDAAKKVEGVTDATVSFMTQKMKVEFADGSDEKAVMENVMYCKNCGMKLENGTKFCGGCGMPVDNEIFEFTEKTLDYMERTIIKKRGSL